MDKVFKLFWSIFFNIFDDFVVVVNELRQVAVFPGYILVLNSIRIDYPRLLQVDQRLSVVLDLAKEMTKLNHLVFLNIGEALAVQSFHNQQTAQCILMHFLVGESGGDPSQVIAVLAVVYFLVEQVEIGILFIEQEWDDVEGLQL